MLSQFNGNSKKWSCGIEVISRPVTLRKNLISFMAHRLWKQCAPISFPLASKLMLGDITGMQRNNSNLDLGFLRYIRGTFYITADKETPTNRVWKEGYPKSGAFLVPSDKRAVTSAGHFRWLILGHFSVTVNIPPKDLDDLITSTTYGAMGSSPSQDWWDDGLSPITWKGAGLLIRISWVRIPPGPF